jgi:nicotinate-nucleotide pyrophosphorylase (carboxylating)
MKKKDGNTKQTDKETKQFLTIVRRALREDIGRGDITTNAIVSDTDRALGIIFAKEEGILCGVDIAQTVFEQIDNTIDFQKQLDDGSRLSPGVTIAILIGKASTCLSGERTALNFLQHLSGIASLTRQFVDRTQGAIKILDTRKTTPGLRIMQKYAVRIGGGSNHRFGLYDMVMIKDNHIQLAGSISESVKRMRGKKRKQFIEVEVQTLVELQEAIDSKVDRIMLDNMRAAQIRKAVDLIRSAAPDTEIELSGGVDLQNITEIAASGADFVSVGALTHSARALDIALKMKPLGAKAI